MALSAFDISPALCAAAVALGLGGCSISPWTKADGNYARPLTPSAVTVNDTVHSAELECLREEAKTRKAESPRIAVGVIQDYTGKFNADTGSTVTQGAALMAMAAFAKAGLSMVERLDIRVAEAELKLANNNLIGDLGEVRQIRAGSVKGSDYFLVGGVTEINYNIRSVAGDAFYAQGGIAGQLYVLNAALDLRLINTETLDVVDVVSLQKQILGREIRAGLFEFFGGELFDLSLEERALEPMQLAVRAMVERAVGDMTRKLLDIPADVCAVAPTHSPQDQMSETVGEPK